VGCGGYLSIAFLNCDLARVARAYLQGCPLSFQNKNGFSNRNGFSRGSQASSNKRDKGNHSTRRCSFVSRLRDEVSAMYACRAACAITATRARASVRVSRAGQRRAVPPQCSQGTRGHGVGVGVGRGWQGLVGFVTLL
jgi:hypothetical protein